MAQQGQPQAFLLNLTENDEIRYIRADAVAGFDTRIEKLSRESQT